MNLNGRALRVITDAKGMEEIVIPFVIVAKSDLRPRGPDHELEVTHGPK